MRIAVASFADETCTFCPNIATLEAWERGHMCYGDDVLITEGQNLPYVAGYIAGYKDVAERESDVELVGILRASQPATVGMGSWTTTQAFDTIVDRIADGLRKASDLDGVLLALHGAMAVQRVPRPEAELVRQVRKTVGKIPIMVTLDLHANEDVELAHAADAVFILKTYPHVDDRQIGATAARCMIAAVRGAFSPALAMRKPGILSASVFQSSANHPMKEVYERCREWEGRGVYCASVAPGFAYADVPDAGASIFVVTDGDQALAEEAAQDLCDLMWSLREALTRPLPKAKEGVAEVIKMVRAGTKPIVIAYHDDRLGDGTHILKELIAQGARNFYATVADPHVLGTLAKGHQVGDTVTVKIGGWVHPISGEPVEVTGRIEYLGSRDWEESGPMWTGAKRREDLVAALNLGDNNHVVISQALSAPLSDAPIKALGIDLASLDIVEIKSRVHHKAFWDTWAQVDYPIDPPGITPADLGTLHYENLPWDVYPVGEKWRSGA